MFWNNLSVILQLKPFVKGGKTMYWIIIVIVAVIMAIKETRKERKHPGYRSWMDDDSVKTFHRPGKDKKWW